MSEKTLPIANDDYFLGCPGVFSKLHNFRLQGPIYFIFLIYYVKSSTLPNQRNNKWALLSGAKEKIGSKWRK